MSFFGLGYGDCVHDFFFFTDTQLKQKRAISEYNEYKKLEFYLISELVSLSLQCIVLFLKLQIMTQSH